MVRPVIRVPAYEPEEGFGTVSFGAGRGSGSAAVDAGLHGGGSSHGRGGGPFSKVPSLLFDLEDLEDGGASHKQGGTEAAADLGLHNVLATLSSLLEPWSEAEYMLLVHVRLAREEAAKHGSPLSVHDLADTLRRLGYSQIKIRTALGGGWGGACLRNLRHTFITVSLASQGGSRSVQYILDAKFKEQFEVAHPTQRYQQVMEGLPQEVLATPDRLTRVVELLCHEMARAFAETGTPLPPWRQTAAMLSKWAPRRSEDTDVLPCPGGYLNNALGVMSAGPGARAALLPVGAPAHGAGLPPRRWSPMAASGTGGASTVAQRMLALGPGGPGGPSPIAEGCEGCQSGGQSLPSDSSSPRLADSSGGSFFVGWPEGEEEAQVVPPTTLDALAQRHPTLAVPVRAHGAKAPAAAAVLPRFTWA